MKDITKQDSLVLKGIAILMILCHHNFRKAGLFAGYTISFWPFTQGFIVDVSFFFKIGVSIFIFITGYGLTLSYQSLNREYQLKKKDYAPWLIKRLIKMLSGYWFVFILMSVICQLVDGRTWHIYFREGFLYGIYQYVLSFLGISRLFEMPMLVFTWWYMSAAVIAVFLVPILNSVAKNYLGYLPTFCMIWMLPHFLEIDYQGDTKPLTYILALFLGCLCAEYKPFGRIKNWKSKKHRKIWKISQIIISIVLLAFCYKEYAVFLKEDKWEMALGIIPFIIIYLCYEYICPIPYVNNILEFVGSHSLNIFLIHTFIRGVYLSDFIYSWKHFMLINLVLAVVSVVASYLVEFLKKILKYDEYIAKLTKRFVSLLAGGTNE